MKRIEDKIEDLGALPDPFIRRMRAELGDEEAGRLFDALDEDAGVSIRFNSAKPVGFSDVMRPVEWCSSGFYLDRRPRFILDPLLHAGVYYVQEAASMIYQSLLERVLSDLPAEFGAIRVLDACAAPGGKSTAMLNALFESGRDYGLVANEFVRKRTGALMENLQKWGDPDVIVTNSDTSAFSNLEETFDVIAVDAPCSGEGMMRREPVARSQWSERLVAECAALQRDIVANLIPALKPGGFLIYSTCTFNREENEENVESFKERYGLKEVIPARRFMPHQVRSEGLFVVVLQKEGDLLPSPVEHVKKSTSKKNKKDKASKDLSAALRKCNFQRTASDGFVEIEDRFFIVPDVLLPLYEKVKSAGIRILSAGVQIAERKGSGVSPSSAQVLSRDFDSSSLPSLDLDLPDALNYLRGQALPSVSAVSPSLVSPSLVSITYKGFPLGLAKNIGTRLNNLYPSSFRIKTL